MKSPSPQTIERNRVLFRSLLIFIASDKLQLRRPDSADYGLVDKRLARLTRTGCLSRLRKNERARDTLKAWFRKYGESVPRALKLGGGLVSRMINRPFGENLRWSTDVI